MKPTHTEQAVETQALVNDELPEGWQKTTLADVATITTGNTPPRKDRSNFGNAFPW
jgi:hypothetical protein